MTNINSCTSSSHCKKVEYAKKHTDFNAYFSSYTSPSNDRKCQMIKQWAPSN